jgi:hypothetical protein
MVKGGNPSGDLKRRATLTLEQSIDFLYALNGFLP